MERRDTVYGATLLLRPFDESLISDAYLGWLNDRELMRFSQQSGRTHTRETCVEYVQSFHGSQNHFWSVHRRADDVQIGTMTAYVDVEVEVADVGILIGANDTRGSGKGKEAWGLALQFLFEERKLRKVTGGTISENTAMVRIFEYHGMQLEGTLREELLLNGRVFDVVRYGLLRREWLANLEQRLQRSTAQ